MIHSLNARLCILINQTSSTMTQCPTQSHYPELTTPFPVVLVQSAKLGSDKCQFGISLGFYSNAIELVISRAGSLHSTDSATGFGRMGSVMRVWVGWVSGLKVLCVGSGVGVEVSRYVNVCIHVFGVEVKNWSGMSMFTAYSETLL